MEKLADPKQESVGIDTRSFVQCLDAIYIYKCFYATEQLETILQLDKIVVKSSYIRGSKSYIFRICSSQITIGELIKDELKKIVGINETMPHAKIFNFLKNRTKHYFKFHF